LGAWVIIVVLGFLLDFLAGQLITCLLFELLVGWLGGQLLHQSEILSHSF
jgi:hypothetical protein